MAKKVSVPMVQTDCTEAMASALERVGLKSSGVQSAVKALLSYHGAWSIENKGVTEEVTWVPGNHYGSTGPGPHKQADVMVIGLYPGHDEEVVGRNLCGPSGRLFFSLVDKLVGKRKVYKEWYLTNLVKHRCPQTSKTMPTSLIKACMPVLQEEIRRVRPKYILCLGSLVIKAICGNNVGVQDMYGSYVDVDIDGRPVRVFGLSNPATLIYSPENIRAFEPGLRAVLTGIYRDTEDADIEYTILKSPQELELAAEAILSLDGIQPVAVDCEWEGNWPNMTEKSWLVSVQFYHPACGACVIRLRNNDGSSYSGNQEYDDTWWVDGLRKLLFHDRVQIVGHFFQADMVWLYHYGLDLRKKYGVLDDDAFWTGYYPGGFDTALAQRVLDEIVSLDLADIAVRELRVPRWDIELEDYIGKSPDPLLRYAAVPDELLDKYGAFDVKYTYEIAEKFRKAMHKDRCGQNVYAPFYLMQGAVPAVAEMMIFGVEADQQRMESIRKAYLRKAADLLAEMRRELNWPEFNPRSADHCVAWMFGPEYLHKDKQVLPDHLESLRLPVVKETASSTEERVCPSVDQTVLMLSLDKHPVIGKIFAYRKLLKVVNMIDNIASFIGRDGKIRSFLAQTNKTGRMNSSRPNMQNLPKRQEQKYADIMGDSYPGPLRSAIKAGEGKVLIACDYAGAELFVAAATSMDQRMLNDCRLSMLPDDDPRKKDIHSEVCVEAFHLDCAPNKSAIKKIGKKHLRDATKTVVFGDSYGGGVSSTTMRINAEMALSGEQVSEEDVAAVLKTLRSRYPVRYAWNDELMNRVKYPGWIRNCFGFIRRFDPSDDERVIAEMQREAVNFIPQSVVAFCVYEACILLMSHPRKEELGYRFAMQVHDELIIECPEENQDEVKKIVEDCMRAATFVAADCDGNRKSTEEFSFSVEASVFKNWA